MSLKGYVCGRASSSPQIDGDLNKPFWADAPWTEDFIDILGDSMPKPRFRTRVKMLWDDDYLYVGADLEEPHVWGTLTERDSVIFHDNDFEVFLDPDGDNHLYAEIEINALGTVWDLLLVKPYRDGGPALTGWDIKGLLSGVKVVGTLNDPSDVDAGWSVEMAIPWAGIKEISSVPCPPGIGDQWRINFSRVQWAHEIVNGRYEKVKNRPEDNWVWSPQPSVDMHRPETWGVLQFSLTPDQPLVKHHGWAEKAELISLYYQQRQYKAEHGRYATAAQLHHSVVDAGHEHWHGILGDWQIDHASQLKRRKSDA